MIIGADCERDRKRNSVLSARLDDDNDLWLQVTICCGLQIRPMEEQLKQRVIGKRYTKVVLAVLGLQSVCQMSRKEREVVSPERAKLGEYVV